MRRRGTDPKRLLLSRDFLGKLDADCIAAEMLHGEDARVALRAVVLRSLIRHARIGRGLARVNAERPAERSSAARKAAKARWDARDRARLAEMQTPEPGKSTGDPGMRNDR